jgi:uncharacterized protein involved in outer membrane biogenesis
VQATLLGVSIAIILALVAALIGPYFVDWNQYRTAFEAQASRLLGADVRVTGAIEVRLLPTPWLGLHEVELQSGGDRARLRAAQLSVEFALGPLLRGEIRAAEMRVTGPELNLGLDANGRIEGLNVAIGINADRLSIERLAIDKGRAVLTDAVSGARLVLDRLWFSGEIRSLAGPVSGEGGFQAGDQRFAYRLAAGRLADDRNLKLKLAIDPVDQPLSIEAEGMLHADAAAPSFDGALTLARPAGTAFSTGRSSANVPWHVTGQIKIGAASALLEQVEFQYGPDERATKFTGSAEIKFGKSPHLQGVLSARQLDLDRMLDPREPTPRLPLPTIRSLAEAFGGLIRSPIPTSLGLAIHTVTLAGTSLQEVRGDLKSDGGGWDVETFEFRAPGSTQVRFSGRLGIGPSGISFAGPATIDSKDPKALVAWLEGRSESARGQIGLLRASGDVTLGSDRIAIDRLKTEVDRTMVEGRLAYTFALDGRPPRLEAELKAAELNFDEALALGRAAFAETSVELPRELALAIDVGQATIAGVAARSAKVQIKLDANGLVIERLSVADLSGTMLELRGQIEAPTTAPRGSLMLDVDSRSLDGVVAVLERVAPRDVEIVREVVPRIVPMKAHVTFDVDGFDIVGKSKSGTAKLGIEATAGPVRGKLAIEAMGDPAALDRVELRLVGQIAADDGAGLIAVLGLARALEVDKRPGLLSLSARGPAGGDLRVDARLAAGGVSASANGTARLAGEDGATARLDVSLSAANAAPLWRGAIKPGQRLPVTLKSRASANRGQLTLDGLSAVIAGTPVRGRLGLNFSKTLRVEGRLEADALDPIALVAIVVGAPQTSTAKSESTRWSSDPFIRSVLDDASGRIEFAVNRATVTSRLIGRQVRGVVRADDGEFALEDLEADVGHGRFAGQLTFRRMPDGTAMRARISLTNVDAAALAGEARPVVSGHLALQGEIEGSGLSPAALLGSLKGSGTVSLDQGQFAGLDPQVFDTVIRAVDHGLAIDSAKIRDAAAVALDGGALGVRHVEGALTVTAGQLRVANTVARGERADLTVSGRIDLVETALDARLVLSGMPPADAPAGTRPEIFATIKGPLTAAKRTIDVSALTAWLTLRSVERETKRIEALEGDRRKPASNSIDSLATHSRTAPGPSRDIPAAAPRPRMIPARPEPSVSPLSAETPPVEASRPAAKPKRYPLSRDNIPRPPAELSPQIRSIPEWLFWPER